MQHCYNIDECSILQKCKYTVHIINNFENSYSDISRMRYIQNNVYITLVILHYAVAF